MTDGEGLTVTSVSSTFLGVSRSGQGDLLTQYGRLPGQASGTSDPLSLRSPLPVGEEEENQGVPRGLYRGDDGGHSH